jgi:hypothetical protein
MGQRVLHRVERGEIQEAAQAAERCRSDPWWCAALIGYTKTLLGLTRTADSAFSRALTGMPDEVRCDWEDLTQLFDGDATADWYRDLTCAERISANRTIWWLADPLFIEPGNERERAHHFRMTLAVLSRDGEDRLPQKVVPWRDQVRFPHGPSYRAALIRLGEPHFMGVGERLTDKHPPTFVLQYIYPVYHFVPTASAVRNPLRSFPSDWTPLDSFPPEQLKPGFGRFSAFDYQTAFFRRSDSTRMVAAAGVKSDPLLQRAQLVSSAIVLARSADELPRILRHPLPGTHTFVVTLAPGSVLVSLEAIGAGIGAGRARFAAGPPPMPAQRVTLSDILLLDSATSLPTDLTAAAPRAASSTRVAMGSTVGLYWEVYNLVGTDTMTLSLSVVEHTPSRLGRLGQLLGVVAATDSTRVRWTESRAGSGEIVGQSIALNVRELGSGRYTLRLEITVPGQAPVAVTREIEIVG